MRTLTETPPARPVAVDQAKYRRSVALVRRSVVGVCLAGAAFQLVVGGVVSVSLTSPASIDDDPIAVNVHVPAGLERSEDFSLWIRHGRTDRVGDNSRNLDLGLRSYLVAQSVMQHYLPRNDDTLRALVQTVVDTKDPDVRAKFDPKVLVVLEQAAFGQVRSAQAKAFMDDLAASKAQRKAKAEQEWVQRKQDTDVMGYLWRALALVVAAGSCTALARALGESSKGVDVVNKIMRVATAPAHWTALGVGGGVLAMTGLGLLGSWGFGLAAVGYGAGWALGAMWLGNPLKDPDAWTPLEFKDDGDVRQSMAAALSGVRSLTEHNPDDKIPPRLRQRVMALCAVLDELREQWERSRADMALADSFDARHIAITYLPDALNSYLAIPRRFADSLKLDNGMTAVATFEQSLGELEERVEQLARDLAKRDAQAFLTHSQFLHQKFAPQPADTPQLKLPDQSAPGQS